MGQGSLFNRPGDGGREPEDEGVRLLGADEAAEVAERGDAAQRRTGAPPPGPPPAGAPRPALRFPLSDSEDPADFERPRPVPLTPLTATGEQPILAVDGGEGELPPWTDPPTGEVPEVVIGEFDDDSEAWSSFSSAGETGGARWRDQQADWDEVDDLSDLVDTEAPLGALAPRSERPTHEEYLTFEDVEDLAEPVRATTPPASEAAAPSPPVKKIVTSSAPPGAATTTSGGDDRPRPARRANGPVAPGVGGSRSGEGEPPGRDFATAVSVGAMISAIALFVFWLGYNVGELFVMALALPVVVLAALELFHAFHRAGHQPATLLGWIACGGMLLAAWWRGDGAIALVMALTVLFGFAWFLLGLSPGPVVANLSVTLFGVAYVGVLGAFAGAMLHLPGVGVGVLFITIWTVTWSDIGGYVIGRRIGRTPLSAASPNKTREGLAAGVGLAVVLSLVASRFIAPFDDAFGASLLFAVVVALVAPLGDLFESMIKRDLGIKDMGSLIPGHGGVLDRFDALFLALPVAYYLLTVLELV